MREPCVVERPLVLRDPDEAAAEVGTVAGYAKPWLARKTRDLSPTTEEGWLAVENGATIVAESGLSTPQDLADLARYGARKFLVGECLMRQHDVAEAYRRGMHRVFGDITCEKYGFTREALDAFSSESVRRAKQAVESGAFKDEIVPVTVKTRKGEVVVDTDEEPGMIDPAKMAGLRPAFGKEGVLTAASSSKISDGAAATVLMSAEEAGKRGLQPLARIVAHATHSQAPEWFTTAPAGGPRAGAPAAACRRPDAPGPAPGWRSAPPRARVSAGCSPGRRNGPGPGE